MDHLDSQAQVECAEGRNGVESRWIISPLRNVSACVQLCLMSLQLVVMRRLNTPQVPSKMQV